ncbi:GDP-fucose protein O-fucosyltransferase 2-like protein [Leptotrombidium deliense]|uniref:GDP-fucose protein O-fucosyltransferase 2 n=1 Tax=Leptotrombidium deliense TaxID=299467 RepID=A0A443SR94_9ACAR|nr:GDP-fucose protein O-fucosyltransferase 2-like protein [Leptotrombidium deliense]
MHFAFYVFFVVLCLFKFSVAQEYCERDSSDDSCATKERSESLYGAHGQRKYLLYEVNVGEGFNLRRDVYLRMAILIQSLGEEWTLVLPPFGPLYHWKSNRFQKSKLKWKLFFDIESMNRTINVIEFDDYLAQKGNKLDIVIGLKHFDDFDDRFVEKYEVEQCDENKSYYKVNDDEVRGWFWSYFDDVTSRKLLCLKIEGFTTTLKKFLLKELKDLESIVVQNAEVVLHKNYGDSIYWSFRRSMRFNKELIAIGDEFRELNLNSNDYIDNTEMTENWMEMKRNHGDAIGGHYLAIHLRREDFAKSRPKDVPSLNCATEQIVYFARKFDFEKVFIATDASNEEWDELEHSLFESGLQVFRFYNDALLDGQIAIVDQWICAHAKLFIGVL